MTQKELNEILAKDPYHVERETPKTAAELILYACEVNNHCPLCGKPLQSKKQKKVDQRKFEVAHIYPNRPNIKQYELLHTLERLGSNCEDFENKIALYLDCHDTQDYHTTCEEYLSLVEIKKNLLQVSALHDAIINMNLEDEITDVVNKISLTDSDDLEDLNYSPVSISNKFYKNEIILKLKVEAYVNMYYTFIRGLFDDIESTSSFSFEVLSSEIKASFIKLSKLTEDKEEIFNQIVDWVKRKTFSSSVSACEAVVSFFVQNCEVFYEIAE